MLSRGSRERRSNSAMKAVCQPAPASAPAVLPRGPIDDGYSYFRLVSGAVGATDRSDHGSWRKTGSVGLGSVDIRGGDLGLRYRVAALLALVLVVAGCSPIDGKMVSYDSVA